MNNLSRLLVLFLVNITLTINAQDWNRVFEYELDAEYQMAEKQFEKAAEIYTKALKLVPNSANLKFKIGYCYLKTDDKQNEAMEFLEEASKDISEKYDAKSIKETKAPPEALLHLGRAYQYNYKFDEAIACYNKYKTFIKPTDPGSRIVEQSIKDCNNSKNAKPTSLRVKIKNLGKKINDDQSNFNPVISADGLTLAYTTQAKKGFDVFIVKRKDDSLSIPQKITPYLGGNYFKTVSLSSDGTELILVLDDPENSDLYVTTYDKKRWSKALKLNKLINSKFNETHACMSQDGNTLYFTSDRKGGYGGLDIYKTTIDINGEWSKPENLGPNINTEFNEDNPFLTPDGKMLFFSSEGHDGYGGYDIYYTYLDGELKAINLGYPLNDARNNNFYFPDGGLASGYTAICNANGFGKNDIVEIQLSKMITLNGKIIPETNSIQDQPRFNITLQDIDQNQTINLTADQNNRFSYDVPPGKFLLTINGNKFEDFTKDFSIPDSYSDGTYNIEAKVKPIVEIVQVPEPIVQPVKVDSSKLIAQVESKTVVPEEVKKEVKKEPAKAEGKRVTPKKEEVKKDAKKETKKPEKVLTPPKPADIPKVIRTTNSDEEGTVTVYTVQLMALKTPVEQGYFKNLNNVDITLTSDNIYRYSAGSSESVEVAMEILKDVQQKGYNKAYIRIDKIKPTFTIQLLALRNPVETSYFKDLTDIEILKGADGWYRYVYGRFSSKEDALNDLQRINTLGYKDAFVKKILQ